MIEATPHQREIYKASLRYAIEHVIRKARRRGPPPTFQSRVRNWLFHCFGDAICRDTTERNHRFLEEALELVQSTGCTRSEAHQLVDYVFSRPVGDPFQEVGGVAVTFAALCSCVGIDQGAAGEAELARITRPDVMEKVRAKQAAKPKHSPLPEVVNRPTCCVREDTGPWCAHCPEAVS
jgi:hypothetical protein